MKTRYYLSFQGYTIAPNDPGFAALKEARAALRESAQIDKTDARRRGWKSAAVIMQSKNGYTVQANRERQSPLWSSCAIVSL